MANELQPRFVFRDFRDALFIANSLMHQADAIGDVLKQLTGAKVARDIFGASAPEIRVQDSDGIEMSLDEAVTKGKERYEYILRLGKEMAEEAQRLEDADKAAVVAEAEHVARKANGTAWEAHDDPEINS